MKYMVFSGKVPVDPQTDRAHDPYDTAIHFPTLEAATQAAAKLGPDHWPGVVIEPPYFCVDLDKCYNDDNTAKDYVNEIRAMFPTAYVELSPGGRGLHVFGRYNGERPLHKCKSREINGELYTAERVMRLNPAFTGAWASRENVFDLAPLIDKYFSPVEATPGAGWTNSPVEGYTSTESDDALIQRAIDAGRRGVSGSFGGVTFEHLWTANEAELSRRYPPRGDNPTTTYDASDADAALAFHLLFWTGGNCERVRAMMQRSALRRDKWDRDSYIVPTIRTAAARLTNHYSVGMDPTPARPATSTTAGAEPAGSFMTTDAQREHFAGCVYIAEEHKIVTPNGMLLKPDQFRAMFGGYEFAMDFGSGKTTKSAWEAFTESRSAKFPKVDALEFRPRAEPGAISERDGLTFYNTYKPIDVDSHPGDVSLFTLHLEKLLPNVRDREILLAYLAAVVQYPGTKFQWAPLIQGGDGNGKTLFNDVLGHAVGRPYVHIQDANDLDNVFNAWLLGKVLICVEDVYSPGQRVEIVERLKPYITNRFVGIQAKGRDQITREICCNFIFNSNHKDAIIKSKRDRRFAIFYTAQQDAEDIARDGMGPEYFDALYGWLKLRGGYAAVTHYLRNYAIPAELNPALMGRAPETSSTAEAISLGVSPIEQEITEAIHEERAGFRGGFISSVQLSRLLENARTRMSHTKRAEVLRSLGYVPHPALAGGRLNVATLVDGSKPRIYVKRGSIAESIETAAEVQRVYEDAQQGAETQRAYG